MIDPKMELLSTVVVAAVVGLEAEATAASHWSEMESASAATGDEDPELKAAIEGRDLELLRTIAEGWGSGKRLLPVSDRGVLKRAMKAYRKTLKVTVLNHESTLGGGPLSAGGRETTIVGIQPPPRYPTPVWRELTRQGKLVANHGGTYELPPGG